MPTERVPTPRRHWIKPFARLGYAARGLIYLVIAGFAFTAALWGGGAEDTRGAIATILGSGPGAVVALLLIVALAGYAAWRFVQSVFDTDGHETSAKGLAIRAGLFVSGVTYAVLVFYVFSLWRGSASEEGGAGGGFATAVAAVVGSQVVAYGIAAIFAGVGVAHVWKAAKKGYRRHIEAPPRFSGLLDRVAVTGLGARGTVFLILALLMVTRGLSAGGGNGEPPGLQEALDYVVGLPLGRILLGAMALGLAAFALYSLAEALWRRINVEDA